MSIQHVGALMRKVVARVVCQWCCDIGWLLHGEGDSAHDHAPFSTRTHSQAGARAGSSLPQNGATAMVVWKGNRPLAGWHALGPTAWQHPTLIASHNAISSMYDVRGASVLPSI